MTEPEYTKYADIVFNDLKGIAPKDMLTILGRAYLKTAKTTIGLSKIIGVQQDYKSAIIRQLQRIQKDIEIYGTEKED